MTNPAGSMAGGHRKARIRSKNKERILSAAVELFAAKGFDGTRLGEIAEHCGLPRANLYYYFESKEGIYTALIEQVIASWDRAFEHINRDREPREAIEDYVRAKLEYSRTHATQSRLFANEMLRGGEFLTDEHRRHMRSVTESRAGVVLDWIKQGRLAPVDPHHFFILLWSTTQFYADHETLAASMLGRQRLEMQDFEDAAATISAIVLDGCCRASRPPHAGRSNRIND